MKLSDLKNNTETLLVYNDEFIIAKTLGPGICVMCVGENEVLILLWSEGSNMIAKSITRVKDDIVVDYGEDGIISYSISDQGQLTLIDHVWTPGYLKWIQCPSCKKHKNVYQKVDDRTKFMCSNCCVLFTPEGDPGKEEQVG